MEFPTLDPAPEVAAAQERRQFALLSLARARSLRLPEALRRTTEVVARTLGIERVSVWTFTSDRSAIRCEDLFHLSSSSHEHGLVLLARDYPSYFAALERCRTIAAHDAYADPRTREFASGYLQMGDIVSLLDAPVWRKGQLIGIVCHEHTGRRRTWRPEEQEFALAVANMVSLALETSERMQLEHRRRLLQQATPLLRATLDQIRAGVALADAPSGQVLLSNRVADRIWGKASLARGVLLSTDRVRAPSGASFRPQDLPLARALRAGERVLGERMRVLRADGTWGDVAVSATPVRSALGSLEGALVVCEDLTERQRLESDVEEQAYRERFIGVLGHDLRSPLEVISLSAQLLARSPLPNGGAAKHLDRIRANCQRMERMIRDLLDFARTRQGGRIPLARRTVDLKDLCQSLAQEVQTAAPGRSLVLSARGDCRGEWDPDRLAQAVSNLLRNAVQYGDKQTPITLRLEGRAAEVTLEVHNRGPPVPAEALPHLFEPFRSAQEPGALGGRAGNLGLGLYIVREVARAHGGTVEAHSEAKEGTSFVLRLPRRPGVEARRKGEVVRSNRPRE